MTHRKNPAAVTLGRRTSAKKTASSAQNARRATRVRLRTLSPEQRQEQARQAAYARWRKR